MQETGSNISEPTDEEVQEVQEIVEKTKKCGSMTPVTAPAPLTFVVHDSSDYDWDLNSEAAKFHKDEEY